MEKEKNGVIEKDDSPQHEATETTAEMTQEGEGAAIPFRQRWTDKLKAHYPDKNLEDDAEWESAMDEYHNDMSGKLDKHINANKELSTRFAEDPKMAAFFSDVYGGENPAVAMIRHYGDDVLGASENPELMDKINAEATTYKEKVAQDKAIADEQAKNWEQTLQNIEAFKSTSGKSDEDIDALLTKIMDLHTKGIMGIFSAEDLEGYDKMLNYDKDVAAAEETGKVIGRNAKIEDKKRSMRPDADLPPDLGSSSTAKGDGIGGDMMGTLDRMSSRKSLREIGQQSPANKRFKS